MPDKLLTTTTLGLRVIQMIQSLFGRKSVSSPGEKKVAIIVGHNSTHKGAYAPAPIGMSEYDFNGLVADKLAKLADSDPRIEIKVFHRKASSSYKTEMKPVIDAVNAYDPEIALELHFNWLNGAGRVEMIHYPNSKNGTRLAFIALETFMSLLSSTGQLLARTKKDRGGYGIEKAKCPYVLTEPFDCSNQNHVDIINRLGAENVARIYYSCIERYFNFQPTFK